MSPELIFFGIKSVIRLAQQGERALIEYAADQPIEFPAIKEIKLSEPEDAINRVLALPRYAHLATEEPFKSIWVSAEEHLNHAKWIALPETVRAERLVMIVNAARGDSEALALINDDSTGSSSTNADILAGMTVVEQWKPDKKPVSPLGRIALAIAEVALDYVAADPTILGAGKNGEKVIKSLALALGGSLAQKLDAATLGPQTDIASMLVTAFVGAGLESLKANIGELISQEHLAKLVSNALDPVIQAAKSGDGVLQVRLARILDTLAGPAAQAAVKTVAENPAAFLGSNFDGSKAAGALVSAVLLGAAKNDDIRSTFSDSGLLKLLTAGLQVATDRPGLFIKTGDDKDKVAAVLTDVAGSFAGVLKADVNLLLADKTIDGRALAAGIAAAAVDACGRNVGGLAGVPGQSWNGIAGKLAKGVLTSLRGALATAQQGAAIKEALPQEKLIELGRIVIQGIAADQRIVGVGETRASEIITAVASAITDAAKQNNQFRVSSDTWLQLARDMVTAVAASPTIVAGGDPRLQQVVGAFGVILAGDKNSVLSSTDLGSLAKSLMSELLTHTSPLGSFKDDLENVALAIAGAMAEDKHLLLSGADWVQIVQAVASEATANPNRLFAPAFNPSGQQLGVNMTSVVLRGISQLLQAGGARPALILKGDIVRDATIAVVHAVAGAPERGKKYQPLIEAAVKEVSKFVADNAGSYGSKEWLQLIRIVLGRVLQGAYDVQLAQLLANPASGVTLIASPKDADALLAGGG